MLRGSPERTQAAAQRALDTLPAERVLWVEEKSALHRRLGQGFDAVVLDLHGGIDADMLGICHGLVWGGGALVLRMPPEGQRPEGPSALAIYPYEAVHVGGHLWDRLEEILRRTPSYGEELQVKPVVREVSGTDEQRAAVEALGGFLSAEGHGIAVLLADRGRGKSSALGLVAEGLLRAGISCVVTAAQPEMAAEICSRAQVPFVAAEALASGSPSRVVLVDEAAALPVPLLSEIVERNGHARIALASTVHGYEGTGRGFSLRFLSRARERCERSGAGWLSMSLEEPVRWSAGDPVERFAFDLLLLDAEPALAPIGEPLFASGPVDRGEIARDEGLLRELFGLLVQAHYRTTPSDLHRLLDAPNLSLHLCRDTRGSVIAANLLALEGGLPDDLVEGLYRGAHRIRGHALPETLVVHSGRKEAGALRMLRSVRIATHPEIRRRSAASTLAREVHEAWSGEVDLFGTMFGATPEILAFRRSLGYELVRVGASRGARSGEPSAVMVRPESGAAEALLRALRADLARELPLQLQLMAIDGAPIDSALAEALLAGLPPPEPLAEEELYRAVAHYTLGPRPYDLVAAAVTELVRRHEALLPEIDPDLARVLSLRVLSRAPWTVVASSGGLPSVPAAMRALRRAVAALCARAFGAW